MPRRVLQGTVVSDKNAKTVIRLGRAPRHAPVYKKFIRRSKRFQAHDEANASKVGDVVYIRECRPISKNKRWEVVTAAEASVVTTPPIPPRPRSKRTEP